MNSATTKPYSKLDRFFRNATLAHCKSLQEGSLVIRDAYGATHCGEQDHDLSVELTVHNQRFYRSAVTGGDLGLAESYMKGHWTCSDFTKLVQIFIRNMNITDSLDSKSFYLLKALEKLRHWRRRNNLKNSRKNIQAHYDLGNDFYSLWLDPTMSYSSAFFKSRNETLEEASLNKLHMICEKLKLQPTDHLLEIGSGWGALACFVAEKYGCKVTTTTISEEQYLKTVQRVRTKNLESKVTVLKKDYRDLGGKYDKIVSIEMIEAVGPQYYTKFFHKCSQLLSKDGIAVMQAIVIVDSRYESHIRNIDFISQYIFPGGSLPSISRLSSIASESGNFRVVHLEEMSDHYAETLRRWRREFFHKLSEVQNLGFNEEFIRMWNYYLCYCEAGFTERQVNSIQLVFAKTASKYQTYSQSAFNSESTSNTSDSIQLQSTSVAQ